MPDPEPLAPRNADGDKGDKVSQGASPPAKRPRASESQHFLGDVKKLCAAAKERIDWDEYFGSMACLAAARSPCERLHVGCVVVRDRRVLSMGYNGFFSGAPHTSIVAHGHEQATVFFYGAERSFARAGAAAAPQVHAEQNAISHAARTGISLDGARAYVTHYPCVNCFKSLVSAGIRDVKYIDDYRNDPTVAELSKVSNVAVTPLS